MSKPIGFVTGGGDCHGLNVVIRAVAKRGREAGGKLKPVKRDGNLIRTARALGILLGD